MDCLAEETEELEAEWVAGLTPPDDLERVEYDQCGRSVKDI